jgi:hypothetical protein
MGTCKECVHWEQMYSSVEAFGYCHSDKIYCGQFEAPKRDELKFLAKEEAVVVAGCDFYCSDFKQKEEKKISGEQFVPFIAAVNNEANKLKDADPEISAALEEFSKTTGKTERTINVPKKEEEKG